MVNFLRAKNFNFANNTPMNFSKYARPIAIFSAFYPLLVIFSFYAAWVAGRGIRCRLQNGLLIS